MNITQIVTWLQTNWAVIAGVLSALYTSLSLFVKMCPTLPADHWLLPIIKFLGNLTQRNVDDNTVRAAQTQATK